MKRHKNINAFQKKDDVKCVWDRCLVTVKDIRWDDDAFSLKTFFLSTLIISKMESWKGNKKRFLAQKLTFPIFKSKNLKNYSRLCLAELIIQIIYFFACIHVRCGGLSIKSKANLVRKNNFSLFLNKDKLVSIIVCWLEYYSYIIRMKFKYCKYSLLKRDYLLWKHT